MLKFRREKEMRNCGNGVENRCGGSSKRPSGGDFTVPELFLELSGLEKSRGLKLTLGPGLILCYFYCRRIFTISVNSSLPNRMASSLNS